MKKKEFRDPGGRTLVLWDKLPGKLSIAAPGEGGFVFLADKETALNLMVGIAEWYNEQEIKNELPIFTPSVQPEHGTDLGKEDDEP